MTKDKKKKKMARQLLAVLLADGLERTGIDAVYRGMTSEVKITKTWVEAVTSLLEDPQLSHILKKERAKEDAKRPNRQVDVHNMTLPYANDVVIDGAFCSELRTKTQRRWHNYPEYPPKDFSKEAITKALNTLYPRHRSLILLRHGTALKWKEISVSMAHRNKPDGLHPSHAKRVYEAAYGDLIRALKQQEKN